jgi:hypothetical protein
MAQISTVIKGAPEDVATTIAGLAAANEIQIVEKTFSNGDYLVIYDDTAGIGQSALVVKGDPASVASQINTIAGGATKIIVSDTFSSGSYILVND